MLILYIYKLIDVVRAKNKMRNQQNKMMQLFKHKLEKINKWIENKREYMLSETLYTFMDIQVGKYIGPYLIISTQLLQGLISRHSFCAKARRDANV